MDVEVEPEAQSEINGIKHDAEYQIITKYILYVFNVIGVRMK